MIRLVDATGASPESWEAAVAEAVRGAREQVPDPLGVEVVRQWADLSDARVTAYRVSVRVAYRQELRAPRARAQR